MATFAQWLLAQEDRVGPDGEAVDTARLARAWKADQQRGNVSSPSGIKRYIQGAWAPSQPAVEGRPDLDTALTWLDTALAEYREQRSLAPVTAQPASQDGDIRDLVAQIGRDMGWLRAAITLILPDEALVVLAEAEADMEQGEPLDWAEMWAKADHSGDSEAG